MPPSGLFPGEGATDRAASLANDRVSAAEVVLIHHLAIKAGDGVLATRLETRVAQPGSGPGAQGDLLTPRDDSVYLPPPGTRVPVCVL